MSDHAVSDEAVMAAQAYDERHRTDRDQVAHRKWAPFPDDQVRRLLTGALPVLVAAERERIATMLYQEALSELADGSKREADVLRRFADLLDGEA